MLNTIALPNCGKGTAIVLDRLNVRADPHTGATVLGLLVASEVVTVWAVDNGWAIVQNTRGLTGWASTQYLKLGELAA